METLIEKLHKLINEERHYGNPDYDCGFKHGFEKAMEIVEQHNPWIECKDVDIYHEQCWMELSNGEVVLCTFQENEDSGSFEHWRVDFGIKVTDGVRYKIIEKPTINK